MVSSRRITVQLRPGSDGDALHVPRPGTHTQLHPPTLYLEKIGQQWLEARGEAQPGVKYALASLPAGYTLWHRPRPKDPKHFDKYLYGHPSHKVFDSPNRFYPHFEHLMDNGGDSMGCPCTVCNGSSGVLPRARNSSAALPGGSSRPSSSHKLHSSPAVPEIVPGSLPASRPPLAPAVQHLGRPKMLGTGMDTSRVDEEGTPDVYRNLVNKLRRFGEIDEPIEEPMSLDWRAEEEILPESLQKLKRSQQWVPRVGDIVLYVRELPEDVHIIRHPIVGDYRMYSERTKLWIGYPTWEAGLVGQTPAEPTTIEDICENGDKQTNVTYSGIRVEPLPDVNNTDKSLSKRHKYIPVRHIRPFALWKQLLHRVAKLHQTVTNAQTVTSTMSLVGKYRFKGVWPDASIYCHGIYIGHEMLVVGDAVRLLPNASHGQTTCTDILVIKSIRLKWSALDKASDNDWDEGRPYNSSVWIYGAAFTSDPARMNKEWFSDEHIRLPTAADDYDDWYPLHSPTKELAIPYSRVMGRLYERNAVALWLNIKADNIPLLDSGREGVVESRAFSREHDRRISSEPNATWYWGDSRAQALDLHTVNGLDVAAHDQLRDPKEWRKKIKIMEGMTNKILPTANPLSGSGIAGRNLRGFMAPSLSDLPVRTQLSRAIDDTSISSNATGSSSAAGGSTTAASRKRSHISDLSDEEGGDEDRDEVNREIKQAMKIVEDNATGQTKKAKVTVVID